MAKKKGKNNRVDSDDENEPSMLKIGLEEDNNVEALPKKSANKKKPKKNNKFMELMGDFENEETKVEGLLI